MTRGGMGKIAVATGIFSLSHGSAIGIGHPRPETSRAIERFLETGGADGCTFCYVSYLL